MNPSDINNANKLEPKSVDETPARGYNAVFAAPVATGADGREFVGKLFRYCYVDNSRNNKDMMDRTLKSAIKGLMDPDPQRRRRAMEPFVRATFNKFMRYLYRYLGNEVECEDVLEDVYGDIWEKPDKLANVSSEKELVRTVYLYYMRKRLREVYRRLNRNLRLPQSGLKDLVAPELGALETLSQDELKETLRKTLGKLKARERRAIEMWMQGMSNRAIANELKTTVGAVKMLEYRTLIKLKKMMKDYCTAD